MLILSERKLRRVIREEFERLMEPPQQAPSSLSVKAESGAEIIMPNPIRERFDEGQVISMKDIL